MIGRTQQFCFRRSAAIVRFRYLFHTHPNRNIFPFFRLSSSWLPVNRWFSNEATTKTLGVEKSLPDLHHPHSQFLQGVFCTQEASRLYDNDEKHPPIDTKGFSQEEKITSKVEFLRWVKKEKQRILSRNCETFRHEKYRAAEEYVKESYFWFLSSAQQSHPLSMYLVGTLLYDDLLHINLYNSLLSDCKNSSFSSESKALPFWEDQTEDDTIFCEREGYKWLWRAALGDIKYNLDPPEVPNRKDWELMDTKHQCAIAWYDIAVIHDLGNVKLNITPSREFSLDCFRVAAERHQLSDAYFWLGQRLWVDDWEETPKEERLHHPAMKNMIKAATMGNAEAMYFLAVSYFNLVLPDPNAYEQAIYWMKKSADAKNMRALFALGNWHSQGDSLPPYWERDLFKAFQCYVEASKSEAFQVTQAEYATLFYNIGVMWYNGKGTMKSVMKAFECYQIAAKMGNPRACFSIADMLRNGIGVGVNIKSAERYEKLGESLVGKEPIQTVWTSLNFNYGDGREEPK